MEKGEITVLAIQFGVLIVVVLLLSNLAGPDTQSTPQITTVYWGSPPPASGTVIIKPGINDELTNASTITVYFSLAYSTHPVSISASRLCLVTNGTAGEQVYTRLPISYDSAKKSYYFTFGPTGQPFGWSCEYTLTLTDSLQQTTTWVGTVNVVTNSTQTSTTK